MHKTYYIYIYIFPQKLEEIVQTVLKQESVDEKDEIFTRCAQRLFKVTKLYVMVSNLKYCFSLLLLKL